MKAIIFGLGSIGKRHMRLLRTYFPEVELWHYNRDAMEPHFEKLVDGGRWKELPLDHISTDDFAVVSTPSEAHLDCARACAEMGLSLFIEKPICTNTDGLDDLIRMVRAKNLLAYVAYPLRFHPFIEHLKNFPPAGPYHFECRSDASKWPSARKLDHVVLELSHEIDLAEHLLGPVRAITGDSDGVRADLTLEHDNGTSTCLLDMASQDEARFIQADGHDYPLVVNDYLYIEQLARFISKPESNLEEAGELLKRMLEFISGTDTAGMIDRGIERLNKRQARVRDRLIERGKD